MEESVFSRPEFQYFGGNSTETVKCFPRKETIGLLSVARLAQIINIGKYRSIPVLACNHSDKVAHGVETQNSLAENRLINLYLISTALYVAHYSVLSLVTLNKLTIFQTLINSEIRNELNILSLHY